MELFIIAKTHFSRPKEVSEQTLLLLPLCYNGGMTKQYDDKVAFVIPAYNEGSVIRATVDSIPAEFSQIIVVNDGSKDNTLEALAGSRATIISHPVNLGQGASLQTGIEAALMNPHTQYIVTFDADGQHRIEDVITMLEHMEKNPRLDIVLGSRFLGKTINMPKSKERILKAAIAFSNKTTGVTLTDTHNGLRVMTREAAERMKLEMPDFSHASEIIHRIAEEDMNWEEVPVVIEYTDYSRGKGQAMINAINIVLM